MADVFTRLARRISMALSTSRQTAATNEASGTSTVQLVLPGGEVRSDVPVLQNYGFYGRSLPGADLGVMFVTGDRSRGVVIASNDQRYRPTDLQPGEVCVYHSSGSRITLLADGSISIAPAAKKVTIDADVTVTSLTASGDIVAGNISLQKHLTSGVTAGSAKSGPPVSE
ncbi:phage baseplate assembly protein V [Acetobacter nitrogenifigens]|nr:phage baseplate assembly protein V [Acetobacter nitrogenifigens]